jgi:hypothetical protein
LIFRVCAPIEATTSDDGNDGASEATSFGLAASNERKLDREA